MKKLVILSLMAWAMGASLISCTEEKAAVPAPAQEVNVSEVVVNNIMARRSIRKYTDQTVGSDTLKQILACGINAPNGMNKQNYEVKVVDDPASVAYLAENVKGLYKAPVYIFIAAGSQYDMSQIDCGLLSANICLSAQAFGLGTCNLGGPIRSLKENPELLAKLGFGEEYELCLALSLGHPAESPEAKPRNAEKVQFVKIAE